MRLSSLARSAVMATSQHPRYLIHLQWNGAKYRGWQSQGHVGKQFNIPTVQDAIQEAVSKLVPYQKNLVSVRACGRTDAGVHAVAMPCHFFLDRRSRKNNDQPVAPFPPATLQRAINYHLKGTEIQVIAAKRVPDGFHARRCTRRRSYLYRIVHGDDMISLFERDLVAHFRETLDVEKMQAKSPCRIVYSFDIIPESPMVGSLRSYHETATGSPYGRLLNIVVTANGYLYHQVRNMVGYLVAVGKGEVDADDTPKFLDMKCRAKMPPMVPAHGLYFLRADYEGADDFDEAAEIL